jgi:glycosyltransferase involved in cell wall biosynthesis
VSGVPDVINDGETGFFLNRVQPEYTVEQLISIINKDYLTDISQKSHQLILENYNFTAAKERYRTILHK